MEYGEVTPQLGIVRDLRDFCRWLESCPFLDGTPFFESAERELEPMRERFRALYIEEFGYGPEDKRGDPDLFDPNDEDFDSGWSESEIWQAMLERIETSQGADPNQ